MTYRIAHFLDSGSFHLNSLFTTGRLRIARRIYSNQSNPTIQTNCIGISVYHHQRGDWIRLMPVVLDTTLCDSARQWLAVGRCFSQIASVGSTNKTDCHDITEILLKLALNAITLILISLLAYRLTCSFCIITLLIVNCILPYCYVKVISITPSCIPHLVIYYVQYFKRR
jgi:hypothetical protein